MIDLITESANFEGTDYETNEKPESSALTYFAAGRKGIIPEAKYDGGDAEPIPGMRKD